MPTSPIYNVGVRNNLKIDQSSPSDQVVMIDILACTQKIEPSSNFSKKKIWKRRGEKEKKKKKEF